LSEARSARRIRSGTSAKRRSCLSFTQAIARACRAIAKIMSTSVQEEWKAEVKMSVSQLTARWGEFLRWRDLSRRIALLILMPGLAAAVPFVVLDGERPTFTSEQANGGALVYQQNCAACHGAKLQGAAGPTLVGSGFMHRWASGERSVGDFHALIKSTMPLQSPESLSTKQYIDVVAYLLSQNGYHPGDTALTPATMGTKLLAGAAGPEASPVAGAEPRPAVFPAPPKGAGQASTDRPTDAELLENSDANWLMYNKSYSGQRYSALQQIDAGNASHLNAVCAFQTGETGSFEAAPVVYDGLMYITTAWNTYALDSTNCKLIWEADFNSSTASPSVVNRGVALYRGKIFRSTPDGHLLALDAKTGKTLWDVWMSDPDKGYWLSAAPITFDGKVFMGEAGADWGTRAHIFAFSADSGQHLWTFDVIPTGSEPGAESWKNGAEHGGGSLWSTFALAPSARGGYLFASIGNPAPDFNGALRPGDNLYTDSVVAIDEKTGRLAWYVQQVPHDVHDWDSAAAPVLYDDPQRRAYMAVATKGAWLYVYDRSSHALLARAEISSHLNIDQPITPKSVRVCPGNVGGAEWNGPAYSPKDGLLFVNSVEWCGEEKLSETRFLENSSYFGGTFTFDEPDKARGWIRAFDAMTGRQVWQHETHQPMVAALTPTAGGVVFTGTTEGEFLVLDAKTGDVLYRFNTGGAIAGAPSTYLAGGKQYVVVPSGTVSRSLWSLRGAATVFLFAFP
jgi:alcohol dehydrogenase (cytochrome c)